MSDTTIEKDLNVRCCSGLNPVDSSDKIVLTPSEVNYTLMINFTHTIPLEPQTRLEVSLPTKLSFMKNGSNVIITTLSINSIITSGF